MYGMKPPGMGMPMPPMGAGGMGGGMGGPQFRFGQGMQQPAMVQPPAIPAQAQQQQQGSPFGTLSPELLKGLKGAFGGMGAPGAPTDIIPQGFGAAGAAGLGAGAVGSAGMGMPQPPAMPDPVTQMPDPRMGAGAAGTGSGINGANYGLLNNWLMPGMPTSGRSFMPMLSRSF